MPIRLTIGKLHVDRAFLCIEAADDRHILCRTVHIDIDAATVFAADGIVLGDIRLIVIAVIQFGKIVAVCIDVDMLACYIDNTADFDFLYSSKAYRPLLAK